VSSLNDGAKVSPEFGDRSDERSEEGQEPENTSEPKIRKCLICSRPFPSAWAGERICRRCKSTSGWRGGALG
jgi:hypothetical protein